MSDVPQQPVDSPPVDVLTHADSQTNAEVTALTTNFLMILI